MEKLVYCLLIFMWLTVVAFTGAVIECDESISEHKKRQLWTMFIIASIAFFVCCFIVGNRIE